MRRVVQLEYGCSTSASSGRFLTRAGRPVGLCSEWTEGTQDVLKGWNFGEVYRCFIDWYGRL